MELFDSATRLPEVVEGEKQHEVICGDATWLDAIRLWPFDIIRHHSTSFDIIRLIWVVFVHLSCHLGAMLFSSTYPHTSLDIGVCKDTGTVTLNLTPSQFLPCEVGRGNMCKKNWGHQRTDFHPSRHKKSAPGTCSTLEKGFLFTRTYHSLELLLETSQMGMCLGQAGKYIRVQNAKVRMNSSWEATLADSGSQTLQYINLARACLTATGHSQSSNRILVDLLCRRQGLSRLVVKRSSKRLPVSILESLQVQGGYIRIEVDKWGKVSSAETPEAREDRTCAEFCHS